MLVNRLAETKVFSSPAAEMRRYSGTDVAVWRTTSQPGTSGPVHRVDREHVIVVLEGELTAEVDGAGFRVAPGDALVIPCGAQRCLRNDGTANLVTLTSSIPGGVATRTGHDPVVVPWSA